MTAKRSRIADFSAYLAIRIIICLIQLLSYNLARKLSRGLAWLVYQIDKRHRQMSDCG